MASPSGDGPTEGIIRIGRYIAARELGRGGMGVVYEAADPAIGRRVAIKLINLQALTGPGEAQALRERLFREARSAGALSHPGIVIVYDVGEDKETAFIAMEFVDGPSLQQVQQKGGPLPAAQVVDIVKQMASALDYAHKNGIVHRDIKPANIMLHQGERVKIADFGIAKITSAPKYTVTGLVMGTPAYMSPEQIEGRDVDGRSDQFALAVVAYELLTGQAPFAGNTYASMVHSIVYGERPSARAKNPLLPAGFDEALARGMATRPEDRFPACAALAAALEGAIEKAQRTSAMRNEETVVISPPAARPAQPAGSAPSQPVQPPPAAPLVNQRPVDQPPVDQLLVKQPVVNQERPAQGPMQPPPAAPMPTIPPAPVRQSALPPQPPPPPAPKPHGAGGLVLGLVGLGIAALSLGAVVVYKFHPFGGQPDQPAQQAVQKPQQTSPQLPPAPSGDQGAVKPADTVADTKPAAADTAAPNTTAAKPAEEAAKQNAAEKKASDATRSAKQAPKTLAVNPIPADRPPEIPSKPVVVTVTVQSTRPWTDTGIDLVRGEVATVTASGKIHVAANSKVAQQQPGGFYPNCAQANKLFHSPTGSVPAPDLSCWSLIGRIGNGAIFPLGMSGTVPAGAGRLYLGVNDDDFSDNSGAWSVEIRVERR